MFKPKSTPTADSEPSPNQPKKTKNMALKGLFKANKAGTGGKPPAGGNC